MGYTNIVQYGKTLELYEYQYDLPNTVRSFRQCSRYPRVKRVDRRQDNIKRLRREFVRLVRANLDGRGSPAFVTLTFSGVVGVEKAWACFHSYCRRLRRVGGRDFVYVAVIEFQKRGSVHFHVLYWGLDEYVNNERSTRRFQHLWGYGYVDCFFTDGNPKLAGYTAKYMSKAVFDSRLCGKRAYNTSRNVLRPVRTSLKVARAFLDELVGVDNFPCIDKEFDTQWLGKGRYRFYNLN